MSQEIDGQKKVGSFLQKRFNTTIIGSLASFEEFFGHLWGFGKDESELTDSELEWREIWEQARTEILDKGNNNSRSVQRELEKYKITQTRYITNFIIGRNKGNVGQ